MKTLSQEELPLTSADGVKLHLVRWPLDGAPRARVLVLHGRGEHGGRYAPVAASLAEQGIECAAMDFRGFGRSEGAPGVARGSLRSFEEYLRDAEASIEKTKEAAGAGGAKAPLFLLGHSAGGLVIVRLLEERPPAGVAGAILSGPFLGMTAPVPTAKLLIVRGLSAVNPDMALPSGGTPNTRDEACWKAYQDDPLSVKAPTARWLTEILANQKLALERASRVKAPVLVLQGGADAASDPKVSRRFAEASGAEYKEYPGCLHEVLNELPEDRKRVLEDLTAWVARRSSGAAA